MCILPKIVLGNEVTAGKGRSVGSGGQGAVAGCQTKECQQFINSLRHCFYLLWIYFSCGASLVFFLLWILKSFEVHSVRSPRLDSSRLASPRSVPFRSMLFVDLNMYIYFWKANVILFWKLLHMWLNVLKFRFSKFIVYFVYFKRYTLRHFILPSIYMTIYFYIFPHTHWLACMCTYIQYIPMYVCFCLCACVCEWFCGRSTFVFLFYKQIFWFR